MRRPPLVHPGPAHEPRVAAAAALARHARAVLPAGASLQAAFAAIVDRLGTASGTASLLGGGFSRTRFTTGGPDRHGSGRAANYTLIRDWGACDLVTGEVSFGHGRDGGLFVHCHAVLWPDPVGIRQGEAPAGPVTGGHLFAADCVVAAPITAFVTAFEGFCLRQTDDAETLHSIFEIESEPTDA
jgi:hypothetical protein